MNCQQKSRFPLFRKGVQKRRPKKLQKELPGTGAAQEVPRAAQEVPRRPQVGPKSRQERPEAPKSSQERTKRAPREPLVSQGPPRSLQGSSRGQFWPHFWGPGLHLKQFILPDVLFIRRNSRSIGFYAVPRFPSLCGTTWTSPRPEITRKCCSKSLVKRSFETAAGQKHTRTMAQWPV